MAQRTVLVEGVDDRETIKHLCARYDIDCDAESIRFEDMGGKESLLAELTLRIKALRVGDAIAVVMDADEDAGATWRALRGRLVVAGYSKVPTRLRPGGLTLAGESRLPAASVWLLPDNSAHGMLEDFVAMLVPDGDVLAPLAETIVTQVEATDRRFSATHRSKAIIHTWLAWQELPGTRMGSALNRRYLDPGRPQAVAFVQWFRAALSV